MPTQDGAWSDQTMARQAAGQPSDEGGEHGLVRPVHMWSRVDSPKDSDLMTQHEQLHRLRSSKAWRRLSRDIPHPGPHLDMSE